MPSNLNNFTILGISIFVLLLITLTQQAQTLSKIDINDSITICNKFGIIISGWASIKSAGGYKAIHFRDRGDGSNIWHKDSTPFKAYGSNHTAYWSKWFYFQFKYSYSDANDNCKS